MTAANMAKESSPIEQNTSAISQEYQHSKFRELKEEL